MPDDASGKPTVYEAAVAKIGDGDGWTYLGEIDPWEGACEINPSADMTRFVGGLWRNANRISTFVAMRIPTVTHNDLEPGMRKGRPYIRKGARLLEAEAKWDAHLGALKDRLVAGGARLPLGGPLMARVKFLFDADERHSVGSPHTEKPDLDNIEKTFWDAMARAGIIEDDKLVFAKSVTKAYDRIPGVRIEIERWLG